jgi:hypothetical protein
MEPRVSGAGLGEVGCVEAGSLGATACDAGDGGGDRLTAEPHAVANTSETIVEYRFTIIAMYGKNRPLRRDCGAITPG